LFTARRRRTEQLISLFKRALHLLLWIGSRATGEYPVGYLRFLQKQHQIPRPTQLLATTNTNRPPNTPNVIVFHVGSASDQDVRPVASKSRDKMTYCTLTIRKKSSNNRCNRSYRRSYRIAQRRTHRTLCFPSHSRCIARGHRVIEAAGNAPRFWSSRTGRSADNSMPRCKI